jgi:DNA-binding protein HU-beta
LVIDSPDSSLYGAEKVVTTGGKSGSGGPGFHPCGAYRAPHPSPKGSNVNKAQLIDAVAEKLEVSRRAAGEAVDAVLDGITGAVVSGEKVSLTGFGTFESARRPARIARNPRTGDQVKVAAATVPKFRAGQAFKDEVNGAKKGAAAKKAAAAKRSTTASAAKKTAAPARATAAKKAAPAKKAAVRKTTATKAASTRTTTAKKAAVTKAAAKSTAKKSVSKKAAARPVSRKTAAVAPATKTAAKKTAAKKATAKKTAAKKR